MSSTNEWAAAARLVRRSGFGATGAQVDACLATGTAAYLSAALAANPDADAGAQATPVPQFSEPTPPGRAADAATRKVYNQAVSAQLDQLTGWWLQRMVAVTQPCAEKLTFAWHNHFATSADKVRHASWMLNQNQTLRRMGRGSFRALSMAMLTDAAMLDWLDGQTNVVGSPNENLSREFMELFALGHDNGYTETDVREGARALTGWKIDPDGSTVLVPRRHDNGVKTFLGVTGDLDATSYRDAVLARSTSYVPARWWGQLVSDTTAGTATLAPAVSAFRADNLSAMFTVLLTNPGFAAAEGALVIGPVEWLIGALRALKISVNDKNASTYMTVLRALGQLPFYPPNVGGWASGSAWLSTAAADTRMQTALGMARAADLSAVSAATDKVEAVAYLLGVAQFCDRSVAALKTATDTASMVAIGLTTPEYLVH